SDEIASSCRMFSSRSRTICSPSRSSAISPHVSSSARRSPLSHTWWLRKSSARRTHCPPDSSRNASSRSNSSADLSRAVATARAEHEALLEVLALKALTEIGLGGHFVPHFRTRRRRQITERTVHRLRCPTRELLDLGAHAVVEERRLGRLGMLESREAEVVAPAFQEREAHALIGERGFQKGQILADELLLEVDRVRRHDRAFLV